LRKKEELH
jgi:hypothetical protein